MHDKKYLDLIIEKMIETFWKIKISSFSYILMTFDTKTGLN